MLASTIIFLIPLFLCWGSFLNVVGYRLLRCQSLASRSNCPACNHILPWYHLIPVASWLALGGRCGFCTAKILWLYPAIELLTAISFTALVALTYTTYLPAYFFFFSAMIVTVRTDTEDLLILQAMTLGIIPVGFLAAATGLLPITLAESMAGALLGAGFLWCIRTAFWLLKRQEGLGMGDVELLAAIGAFVGPMGVFYTTMIGSFFGGIVGLYMIAAAAPGTDYRQLKLPFGTLLAVGALFYVIFSKYITLF